MEEWLSPIIGAVISGVAVFLAYQYVERRRDKKERMNNIYAPLYTELANKRNQALHFFPISDTLEWERIKQRHLIYHMPEDVRTKLEQIYDDSLNLSVGVDTCRRKYSQKIRVVMGGDFTGDAQVERIISEILQGHHGPKYMQIRASHPDYDAKFRKLRNALKKEPLIKKLREDQRKLLKEMKNGMDLVKKELPSYRPSWLSRIRLTTRT